ncbi:hypothetical protein GC175_28965 [bacterium]|nr:hypothetical protein [bacterium]
MLRASLKLHYVLGSLVALLLAATAGAGLIVEDIYRPFLSESIVAFQFFQDFVSLMAAPALVVAMLFAARGSRSALAIWAGLLLYAGYYYVFYVFDFVYTVFYPLYLALMGMAFFSLVGLINAIDADRFAARVKATMPVRMIAVVLGITVLFVPIWLMGIAQAITTQQAGDTDLVFVLDLAFLIPVCVYTAIQVWRRRPIGFVFAGPLLLKAALSGVLLTGGTLLLSLQFGQPIPWDQMSLYIFLAVVGGVALAAYLHNLTSDETEVHVLQTEREFSISSQ